MPQIYPRDYRLDFTAWGKVRPIMAVTGLRRVGKTYILYQEIQKLLQGHSREQVVYLNFEDERLPQKTEILTSLLPTITSVYGRKPLYLFLDEIQNVPLWSKWLRRVYDANRDIWFIVSGSSSKISGKEIPTELRGRGVETQIYPLSLREFFTFKNYAKEDLSGRFNFEFGEYLKYGGLPVAVLVDAASKMLAVQQIYDLVIERDILDRYKIKNEEPLRTLFRLLVNSTSITISKLYNSLKSLGVEIGKTTVNEYVTYAQNSFLLTQLFIYSPSVRRRLSYPRKIYLADNGFVTAMASKFSPNYGRLLENLVFWKLYKEYKDDLFYYADERGEVDFAVVKDDRAKKLFQVCYDLTDWETRNREIKTLKRVGKKLGVADLNLVVGLNTSDFADKDLKIISPKDFF